MMYDIHTHILPNTDDGASSAADALQMLRGAAMGGTKGIVCTPHCCIPNHPDNLYDSLLQNRFDRLRELCAGASIPLQLYLGQEIFLTGPVPALLAEGKLITVNRSRYLLCEFAPGEHADLAVRKLQRLTADGYVPVVAHPERYRFLAEDIRTADRMKAAGALLQPDACSLTGELGPMAAELAGALLRRGAADCIASDAHSPYSRTANLSEAYELICNLFSYDYAKLLFCENPRRIIEDLPILTT